MRRIKLMWTNLVFKANADDQTSFNISFKITNEQDLRAFLNQIHITRPHFIDFIAEVEES